MNIPAPLNSIFMQKISPCLWFDSEAEEAANFYVSLFKKSKKSKVGTISHYVGKEVEKVSGKKEGTVVTVEFTLCGLNFTGLNAGPIFKFNPSISFAVSCETEKEIDELWEKFSPEGKVLMPLEKYPFAKKFGWIQDKYGVSWQLILNETPQKITPYLMFTLDNFGKCEEAMKFYCSVFKDSKMKDMHKARAGEPEKEGTVSHATFQLAGQDFMAMESSKGHKFTFSEAISLMVDCKDQEEVDYYWNKLTADGGKESQCGWLYDKYGVSWQIVPSVLNKLMTDKNLKKAEATTNAMLKMKKLDMKALQDAHDNA